VEHHAKVRLDPHPDVVIEVSLRLGVTDCDLGAIEPVQVPPQDDCALSSPETVQDCGVSLFDVP
jgi:hypothetical protein